ncbi:unnamed protein product, partial [Symbiodinium microadriaticum]
MVSLTKDLRLVDAELQSLPAPQSQKKIRVKQLNMLYSVTLLFRSETNGKVVEIRDKARYLASGADKDVFSLESSDVVLKFNKTQPEKSEQSLFDEHFKDSGITSWMYGQLQMSIFPEGLISSRPLPPGEGLSRSMTMSQGEAVSCCMVLAERALCTGELAVTQLASQPLSSHLWQQILALTEQTLMKIAQLALQHNMTPWDLKLDNLGLFADGTWRVIDFEPFELNEIIDPVDTDLQKLWIVSRRLGADWLASVRDDFQALSESTKFDVKEGQQAQGSAPPVAVPVSPLVTVPSKATGPPSPSHPPAPARAQAAAPPTFGAACAPPAPKPFCRRTESLYDDVPQGVSLPGPANAAPAESGKRVRTEPKFLEWLGCFSRDLLKESPCVALDFGQDGQLENLAVGRVVFIMENQYVTVQLLAHGSRVAVHGEVHVAIPVDDGSTCTPEGLTSAELERLVSTVRVQHMPTDCASLLATQLTTATWEADTRHKFRQVMLGLSTLEVTYATEASLEDYTAEKCWQEAFASVTFPEDQRGFYHKPAREISAAKPSGTKRSVGPNSQTFEERRATGNWTYPKGQGK